MQMAGGFIYFVVVSGVGIVYEGKSLSEAATQYGKYVLLAKNAEVDFVRKTVTLLEGETVVMRFDWEK
jgi:hypothetical protein